MQHSVAGRDADFALDFISITMVGRSLLAYSVQ